MTKLWTAAGWTLGSWIHLVNATPTSSQLIHYHAPTFLVLGRRQFVSQQKGKKDINLLFRPRIEGHD
jgi:hypothetical protein